MNRRKCVHLIIAILSILFTGCAQQVQLSPAGPVVITGVKMPRAMEIAEDVLTGMNFVIEKLDVETGYIKTRPLRGAQGFEFWRTDNASRANAAEANIHSIQRTAWVEFTKQGGEIHAKCDVQTRRLSMPEQPILGISYVASLYTGSSRSLQSLRLPSDDFTWIDLGPDPALEQKILQQIQQKIAKLEGKS